jgi:ABC-type spermidine/putrescine transport system permease subunit I
MQGWSGLRNSRAFTLNRLALALIVLLLVVGLIIPIAEMVWQSVQGSGSGPNPYRAIFENDGYVAVLRKTLIISVVCTVVTLLIAYPLSYYIWNRGGTARVLCFTCLIIPYFTSIVVKNFSWIVILQDKGPLNDGLLSLGIIQEPLHLLFTLTAVIIGMSHYLLPIAVAPIYTTFLRLDRVLLSAARSLGASRLTILRTVILPLTLPGLVGSAVIVFVLATGFYVTPALLGGRKDQMAANLIDNYITVLNRVDYAAALAAIVSVVILLFLPIALRHIVPQESD